MTFGIINLSPCQITIKAEMGYSVYYMTIDKRRFDIPLLVTKTVSWKKIQRIFISWRSVDVKIPYFSVKSEKNITEKVLKSLCLNIIR